MVTRQTAATMATHHAVPKATLQYPTQAPYAENCDTKPPTSEPEAPLSQ